MNSLMVSAEGIDWWDPSRIWVSLLIAGLGSIGYMQGYRARGYVVRWNSSSTSDVPLV